MNGKGSIKKMTKEQLYEAIFGQKLKHTIMIQAFRNDVDTLVKHILVRNGDSYQSFALRLTQDFAHMNEQEFWYD